MEELDEDTSGEGSDVENEISVQKPQLLDTSITPGANKQRSEATPGEIKGTRGKNREYLDCWYDDPDTWKHCYFDDCTAKVSSRFKVAFRDHKFKCHKGIEIDHEI